ncbi:hypothetical protein [Nicoliella lavandulae]|uniref:Uncharacterized protein n=1 Tax=Nicoliella lavandulae TaxID=3082954 RepID=A0ABU8SM83_9LACO
MAKINLTKLEIKHLKTLVMVNSNFEPRMSKRIAKKLEQVDYHHKPHDERYDRLKSVIKTKDKHIRSLSIELGKRRDEIEQLKAYINRSLWQKIKDLVRGR